MKVSLNRNIGEEVVIRVIYDILKKMLKVATVIVIINKEIIGGVVWSGRMCDGGN